MRLPRGLVLSVALSLAAAACGVGSLEGVGGAGGTSATGGSAGSGDPGGSGGAAPATAGSGGGDGLGGTGSGMLMGQCAPPMGAGGGGHASGAGGGPSGGTGGMAVADAGTPSGCDGVPQRMPIKNNSMVGTASPDGRIYLFAGWAPNDGRPYCAPPLLEYDPTRDSYRRLASGPFAIFAVPTLAFAHGKLVTLENRLGLYDPVSDTWSEGAPPPIILFNRTATVGPDGRVYFLGGEGNGTNVDYGDRADVYDPVTDHWSPLPNLPFRSYGDAAVTVGGRIYLTGLETAVFDPASQRWSQLPSPPTPRYWSHAEVDGAGRIVSIGGLIPGGNATGIVEIFDPIQATWSAGQRLPVPVFQFATASACGRIFVFGGSASGYTDLVQAYGAGDKWVLSP